MRQVWRRHDYAAVALLALLTLGLVEPLACILHCEFWAATARQLAAGQHSHQQHAAHTHAGELSQPALAPPGGHDAHGCPEIGSAGGQNLPSTPQPQPFHEMALVATLLLMIALPVAQCLATLPNMPPQHFTRPPLRPPLPALP